MRSKKAIINIVSSLLLQLVTIICSFIIPKLFIQKFGSSTNGLITSITQFLAYIALLESGFGPVVKSILYKPIANKDKEKIETILKTSEKFFRTISYIFIVYIVILCIVLPLILSNEFDIIYTASLVIIISISIFAEYYFGMTYRLFLQAEQKTYIISIIQIGTLILNTIVTIVLIKLNVSIQIIKLASTFIFIFRPILQNIYVKKKYKLNLKDAGSNYKIKQKWDGLAQHIAAVIHNNTDVAILTLFVNTTEVSVYSIYLLIINGIKNLTQALTGGVDALFGDMIAKKEKLNDNFKIYEGFYFTISTIICLSTLFLISPFVSVYTNGIKDANYIRPIFGYIIVIAESMWILRLPYSSITLAAGHFKETRKGAWIEAISNFIISIVLVGRFGIIGVAIGTLFAMTIRTMEFMYHASKYILNRSVLYTFKRVLIIAIEIIIVAIIIKLKPKIEINNYFKWIMEAIIIVLISVIVVIPINSIIYKENLKDMVKIINNIFNKNIKGKYKNEE